jgi:hypothetical protein
LGGAVDDRAEPRAQLTGVGGLDFDDVAAGLDRVDAR